MKKTLPPPARTLIAASLLGALSAPALAAAPVVISQVYGGGGNSGANYRADFIELFNRSDAPVNLAGWSVQYGSSGGSTWQVTNLKSLVLQPGQYYLVQQALGAGGSEDLPTPDSTGTIAMSASAGKVALVSSTAALSGAAPLAGSFVDLVGFGGANYAEGTPTATLSNTSAALRAAAGCTDTDNNGSDFATGAPTPRNSASPLNQCGVPQQPPIVATCPVNLALAFGVNGGAELSATDADGTVNSAVITSAPVGRAKSPTPGRVKIPHLLTA